MERTLVIGASGGIGAALRDALAARPGAVVALSRSGDGLDVTDEASVTRVLGALEGPFDLVFVATGVLEGAGRPPEKALKELSPEALVDQFRVNAVGPLILLKHLTRLLPRDRRAVVAALSARVGSIGDNRLGGWYSYRMAKAALNQGLHSAAIELKRTHERAICVALHPGTVATPFTAAYAGRHRTVPPEEAAANLLRVIDGLSPADTGGFFDWAGERVVW
ncbi:Short-chain dehydrogenase [Rhodovulum sp. ES.010]|uniref:SDR family NAD(P)-dependent oxidoreductase n=1 Tax=Rhodovulum sp. ES.010 TaxID=1882821 RepID=UPI00092A0DB4|nr:SDR family NAD(P)-dependent oxidoreductase [Rhodovulum sp. ES.010]SIO55246.1 Short-chain dehydrogenase [Rhodovulum sp. ES.010]